MISMDWLSSSHRGVRAWEERTEERGDQRHKGGPRENINDGTGEDVLTTRRLIQFNVQVS